MSGSRLSLGELERMTMYANTFSAQIRDGDMALLINDSAPRSSEDGNPVIIPTEDLVCLYDLLHEAATRGELRRH